MKESLERLDSAALFALLGQTESARTQAREHRLRFDRAFAKAANNITEPGEREIIRAIADDRAAYYRLFDQLVPVTSDSSNSSGRQPTSDQQLYFERLEPLFNRLRASCDDLLRLNQAAMLAKSDTAREAADRWYKQMLLIAGALTLAGLALAVFLSERIVRPVRELTSTTARLAGGDLEARARITSRDEIGLLSAEYNRMAERLRQLRRSDKGKLIVAQTVADKTIDALNDPLIVTDVEGHVTKLNHAAEAVIGDAPASLGKPLAETQADERIIEAITETLRSRQAVVAEDVITLPPPGGEEGRAFRLRATPVIDAENALLGVVTLLEDVSYLRRYGQDKERFIRAATDELRAPLTNARMALHVLLEEAAGGLNDKQAELLYAARADCETIDVLLNRFRELPTTTTQTPIADLRD
jgi:nitrogen fixation/metabolism regulation signal transduction histidine kinase